MIELMVTLVVALVVALAIGQVDVTRVLLVNEMPSPYMSETAFIIHHMSKHLLQADRVVLLSPSSIQFRIPTDVAALDSPAATSYRWGQYKLGVGDEPGVLDTIYFYDNTAFGGCAAPIAKLGGTRVNKDSNGILVLTSISGLDVQYRDEAITPPGGEPPVNPPGADNNLLEIVVSRSETKATGGGPQTKATSSTGEVTIRAGADTDLMTGLALPGIHDPPPTC